MADKMLACGACLRRTLQTIPRRGSALQSVAFLQPRPLRHTTRPISSTAETTRPPPSPPAERLRSGTDMFKMELQPVSTKGPLPKKDEEKLERKVMKELQYLPDPWKIGEWVKAALEKDRYLEALTMARKASKDHSVEVSWNYLIGYNLKNNQITSGIKLYNEMKKRAQLPNTRTYTTIFRELAQSQHPKIAMSEALKLYNKMLTDKRITLNTFHLNAMLNVCNRAGDLDAMFSVADSIDEVHRVPTAFTYTTILNGLRFNARSKEVKDLPPEQEQANGEVAIQRGRAIWEEVMRRRRKGQLEVDEELVCAMGRLLATSRTPERARELLDLLEQTMGIPNLLKKDDGSAPDSSGRDMTPGAPQIPMAKPGNNALSLILGAVARANMSTAGIKYWNLLVREHQVVPDRDCWVRMFGLLKKAKASAHAAEILDIVPDGHISFYVYRMVMETCIRDNINANAIKNATRALDSMTKRLPVPDPHTMRLYLRVAQAHHYHLRARSDKGDHEGAKRMYGLQIAKALERLWQPYRVLHNHYFKEAAPSDERAKGILYNNQREVIALARIMYGAYNKIIQQEMLPEADLAKVRPVGGRINREIQAFFAEREKTEPNLRKGRGNAEKDMNPYEPNLRRAEGQSHSEKDTASFELYDEGSLAWDTTAARRPKHRKAEWGRRRQPVQRDDDDDGNFIEDASRGNRGRRQREGYRSGGSRDHRPERRFPTKDQHARRPPTDWFT